MNNHEVKIQFFNCLVNHSQYEWARKMRDLLLKYSDKRSILDKIFDPALLKNSQRFYRIRAIQTEICECANQKGDIDIVAKHYKSATPGNLGLILRKYRAH